MHFVEVSLERIHVTRPEITEWSQPFVELLKRLRIEAVEPPLRIDCGLHESGVPQNSQVFRDGRLRHAKPAFDLAYRLL